MYNFGMGWDYTPFSKTQQGYYRTNGRQKLLLSIFRLFLNFSNIQFVHVNVFWWTSFTFRLFRFFKLWFSSQFLAFCFNCFQFLFHVSLWNFWIAILLSFQLAHAFCFVQNYWFHVGKFLEFGLCFWLIAGRRVNVVFLFCFCYLNLFH